MYWLSVLGSGVSHKKFKSNIGSGLVISNWLNIFISSFLTST